MKEIVSYESDFSETSSVKISDSQEEHFIAWLAEMLSVVCPQRFTGPTKVSSEDRDKDSVSQWYD